jgi:hypothetical protein
MGLPMHTLTFQHLSINVIPASVAPAMMTFDDRNSIDEMFHGR